MKVNSALNFKVLLIYPPSTVCFGDPTVPSATPPLGIGYIASYLEKFGYRVVVLDAMAEGKTHVDEKRRFTRYGMTDKEILKKIHEIRPNIVGISSIYTAYAGDAHRVAGLVKKLDRKIPVIFGGAHSSIFPELTLRDKNVDAIVVGEGEISFLTLVEEFFSKGRIKDSFGIVTKVKGKIVRNRPNSYVKNLDLLPFPAWHLFPMKKYLQKKHSVNSMREPSMMIITSRGCPGQCKYCSIHSVWGKTWRGRGPDNVIDEIEFLTKNYGIKEVNFMDDSIGVSRERLIALCDGIIKRKLDIRWNVPNGIAHWLLDEKILDKMKKSGCYRVTFGIESGDLEIRKFIGKPYPLEQAKRMIMYANKIGMWTICTYIIGFPYETDEQINRSINFAIESDTDLAVFYLLCPHPGTKIYEIFKKENLINFDFIFTLKKQIKASNFVEIGKALAGRGVKTKNFSEFQLKEITTRAYKTFFRSQLKKFLNPIRILRKIHSWEDLNYSIRIGAEFLKIFLRSTKKGVFGSQMLRKEIDFDND